MAVRLKGRSSVETRSAILDLIRSSGQVSRTELAEKSGLTEATISKLVRSLILDGIVVEAGYADSTGGKRPVLLELNTRSGYALGISLDTSRIVYVLSDLGGEPVHRMTSEGAKASGPPEVVKRVASELNRMLRRNGIAKEELIGIGVAVAGRLDRSGGTLRSSVQTNQWEEFDIEAALGEASGLPVVLDNDANCAALGEFWSGRVPATRDFAMIYMASGIGCGLMINGDIYRGYSSNAGEIDHLILDVNGPECWCGSRGCLETLATPGALVRRARADAELAERVVLGVDNNEVNTREAFAALAKAAREGDPKALALIEESAGYLGKALVSLINLFDLDKLYLAGPGFADVGHLYLDIVRDQLNRLAFTRSVHPVDVEMSAVGPEAAALGAASVVLHSRLTPHHLSFRR
jgi:predicted NBD/HSP70 family sugar kinase